MDWGSLARAVHVVAIVVWIGGVSMVTTVVLPAMREQPPEHWIAEFERVEARFARQARIALLLALLSGLYMLQVYSLWGSFADPRFWWMDLMVGVWALFALMLFVIEPLGLRRVVQRRAEAAPQAVLARLLWLHRGMLLLALAAVFAAVGGAHGLF